MNGTLKVAIICSLILTAGCAQSPKDIRLEKNEVVKQVRTGWEDLASCVISEMDENIQIGPLKMRAANSLRTFSDRAEIISNYQDTTIAVVDIRRLAPGLSEASYNTTSYQILYTGALKNALDRSIDNCSRG